MGSVPEIRLERVAAADAAVHDAVLGVLRAAYLPFEAVSVMSGTASRHQDSEAFLDVARMALKDGTSIGAFREADGILVGVAVNFTMIPVDPAGAKWPCTLLELVESGTCQQFPHSSDEDEVPLYGPYLTRHAALPSARWLADFIRMVYSDIDEFAIVGGGPLLEHVFLAVLPEVGRCGIGRQLVARTVNMARDIGAKGVTSTFTSDRSWAIGKQLGFRELAVVEHSQFLCGDKPGSEVLPASQQRSVVTLLQF